MAVEENNHELNGFEPTEAGETPPEESSNRTFIIVAASLGAIMLLTLVCIALFGLVYLPRANQAKQTEVAQVYAQQTVMAISVMQTNEALKATLTYTPTAIPTKPKPSPTATQVIKKPATATSTTQANSATLTVAALYTKAALTQTALAPTATALPTSGFADEVGLPGLLALGGALLVVIFLARRLRTAS
jgi:hypothetical protein